MSPLGHTWLYKTKPQTSKTPKEQIQGQETQEQGQEVLRFAFSW